MLGRSFLRRLGPVTYNFIKSTTTSQSAKPTNHSASRSSVFYCKNACKLRWYSQQASPGEMLTVDYDYVKKVTINPDILIIDVREPEEVKEHGKIPNSINIPLGSVATILNASDKEFEKLFKREKPDENTEIIFYCMIGKRSGMAQQNALNLGFKNAKNYLGSWIDWAAKSK